jgi:long-chain-fatty-acid--[acyl-carrier-protein] ligase
VLQFIRYLAWVLGKLVLSLRYRIHVQGLEKVRGLKGPVLILPNHPGYIDPPLVLTSLWTALHPRPLLFEDNFQNPVLAPLAKLLRAILVPGLEQASAQARERTEKALTEVIEALRRGDNVILWPAGRTQREGIERIGGARAAADILRAVPEAQVLLVRTRGVWGSSFSYAYTGKAPRLLHNLASGAGLLLANLLMFMPRRPIDIIVEHVDRRLLPELRRETLNPWLEEWYNSAGPETPTFRPYHFAFGPRTYEFPRTKTLANADLSKVTDETKAAIAEIIAHKLHRPLTDEEQRAETTLDQLGLDSLDRMEVTLAVEQRFGFSGDQVPVNIGQLWALAQGLVEREPPKPPPPEWFQPPADTRPLEALGTTIPAAFVARALASRKEVAVADDLSGVLTYERFLVAVLTMARRLRRLPAPNVGLMLPASVGGDMAFFALHLAGKLPVLLNWTTGPANLAHAARTLNLTHVVTSKNFLDRSGVGVEGVQYLYLEEIRKDIGKWELLRTLLYVRLRQGRIRRKVPQVEPDRPALVLFTSGSERAPKAVPLTHTNILSEMRGGVPVLGLTRKDTILGFLPAFHSFGIAVTTVLPLLGGMPVVHHPDPTDAGGLARKIAAYRPTFLVGTPTFVNYIFERAKPGELESLRLIIVGAE